MNIGPVILNEIGAFRMDANYRWEHEEARRRKLRNPWDHNPRKGTAYQEVMEIMGAPITGTRIEYPEVDEAVIAAWRVERDEYMRQRDEWIALEVFNAFGYEAFLEECDFHHLSADFRKSVFPCESKSEPQCSMFCPIFNNCAIRAVEGDEVR